MGDISQLGCTDLLVLHHCSHQLGRDILSNITIPSPPSPSECLNLYNYEVSQESIASKDNPKNVLSQPRLLSKALLAAAIGIDHGCTHAIETGTHLGASSFLFSGVFNTVDTIEADRLLHESSCQFLTLHTTNVCCHLGDSSIILPQIINLRKDKTLVFLDAHYSGGVTSSEFGICPLINELEILQQASSDLVIVIDDIRCVGTAGFPSLIDILKIIPEGKRIVIHYDQLIIY